MSWESDERDAALEKLERIRELCDWVTLRRLPAHKRVVAQIKDIIDGPDR